MKKISIIIASLFLLVAFGNRAQAQCTYGTDCYIVISGHDSYGDGWNGNTISITQGTTSLGTFTLSGGSDYVDTFRVCTANGTVDLTWTSGSYSYEVSFVITDSLGALLYTCTNGSNLTSGNMFAQLSPCPSCPGVGNFNATLTASSAAISWQELGEATTWYYCLSSTESPTGNWTMTTSNSVTFNNLNSNTLYYFFVYSDCGSGDTSMVNSYVFRTECGPLALPYTEGFESYNDDENIPFCWTRWEHTLYPQVSTYYYYAHSGTNSFEFYPRQGDQSVITPRIPVPANTIEVLGWVRGSEEVQVGYVTTSTPTSASDFHQVGSIISTSSYDYAPFSVSFDTVTCTDSVYVVFRSLEILEWNSTYIDDLTIRQINNCPQPSELTITASPSESVSLSWTSEGSAWEVAAVPHGTSPDSVTNYTSSTTTSVTLTNLDNTVLYDFYVRTVCGTQHSYWSEVCIGMPNVYTVTANADTITTCDMTIVDNGGIAGVSEMSTNQTIVLLPNGSDQTVRIRGMVDLDNGYNYEGDRNIVRIFAGSDTTGLLLASYTNVHVTNIDITSEVGAMTIWYMSASYSSEVDEGFQFLVSCEDLPDCTTPYGIEVSNITGNSATVSWQYSTALGEASGFTLTLFTLDDTEVGSYSAAGTDRSYTITGLSERTAYRVQLNVDCDGIDSIVANFVTVCNNGGELEIGDGTNGNEYLPAYLYYATSVSQQIFLGSELGDDTLIYGFKVYLNTAVNNEYHYWDVFVDTTSLTSYTGTGDYVAPTLANRYFSGALNVSQGWVEVSFDSAFTLPAGKNMVLTVNDKTGSSNYNSRQFRVTPTESVMAIYGYDYSGVLDATNSNLFSSISYYSQGTYAVRNTIQFLVPCNTSSCFPPTIENTDVTSTTATVTWTAGNDETAWRVEYRVAGSDTWTLAVDNYTTTSYTITGLSTSTTYNIRVSSLCGDEVSPRVVSVTTLCGAMALPFSESFVGFLATSYGEDQLEMCWNRGSNYAYSSYYPYIYDWYSFDGDGACLSFGGYRSYIVLPQMEARVDSLNIKFYAFNSSPEYYSPGVEVGVCTNPADTNTFTVLYSQPVMGDWELIDVDFENYTAGDGRIFIRVIDEYYTSFFVDSILVDRLPDCRRVNDVAISNVTTSSATVTITDNHNYGSYIISYGTTNDISEADTMLVTSTTATISGLDANTEYYVWVTTQCTAGHMGSPYIAGSFRTECNVFAVTDDSYYLEEFETPYLNCMHQQGDNGLNWTIATNYSSYYAPSVLARSGGRMGYISSQNEGGASAMLVLPTFDFTGMSEDAVFSFYRLNYRNADYNGEYNHPAGHLEVYYRLGTSGNWTLLSAVDSTFNTWTKVSLTLPSSQGVAAYQVAVKGIPNGNYSGIYVDDFKVSKAPTCFTPENVTVSNVTERTATVSWTGGASNVKVQYRPLGNLSWNARTAENANSIVLSPLQMATEYELRVTSICSAFDHSEPSEVITFVTDFCDNRAESNNYVASATDGSSVVSPVDVTKYYSYSEIIVDSAVLAGMEEISAVSFYIDTLGGAENMANCEVYMAHTNATALTAFLYDTTFVKVYEGSLSTSTVGPRRVRFNTPFVWDGHSNVIVAFRYSNTQYNTYNSITFAAHEASANKMYYGASNTQFNLEQANMISASSRGASNMVPDLTLISCLPTCYDPVISAINTTADAIEVVWYNEGGVIEASIKPTAESTWDMPIVVDDDNRVVFEGLTSMTSFDIRLRRDCSSEDLDYSDWVYATAITDTACSIPDALAVSNVTGTTATLSWTDGPMNGNAWEIHVWNNNVNMYYDVTTNPATIDGLIPGSSYHAAVRTSCGSNNHVVGEYSDDIVFDNLCQPVTNLTATVNGHNVTLNWTAGAYNTQWLVSYGYYGFEPNEQLGYMIVNTNSATITGLGSTSMPNPAKGVDDNRYSFRVRAICADGWNSAWSSYVDAELVGINEVVSDNGKFTLQPNPAVDRVALRISEFDGNAKVSVLSVDGRRMFDFNTSNSTFDFDVSSMAAGTYFVRVQTNNWTAVRKLIVK